MRVTVRLFARLRDIAGAAELARDLPPGATIGSMFKNPPNDDAGRLIEAAGLKGAMHGGALISPVHATWLQLARLFTGFEIVRDDVVEDTPDWAKDRARLVRFVARKR